ncbi:MAG: hypothetical protein S4CHLAM45_12180 [Chlamydiales bacterium]|nr:hypothetical protein [Chlamydiales bacterium]MCH9619707.1 hypothetical protein [Chlamydiales bacterium]MCH9623313.1 hypothetical protein [Chlamydiales bacterium]
MLLPMKVVHESIFFSSLRAFFVTFFGSIGAFVGFALVLFLLFGALASKEEKHQLTSNVKILPDSEGNRKELPASTPIVLQIEINSPVGKEGVTAEKIQEILLSSREDAFKDDRVKAILLTINCPGGGANETNTIYNQIKQYKERYAVPVFAYIDGMCASGGFYIACAADKIYASPVSLVGSVGVVAWPPYINIVDAMDKMGISATTLTAGDGKDSMNPTRVWTEDEQNSRQHLVDFFYNDFVNVVAANRPHVSVEQLIDGCGAEVFPAEQSKERGMIDQVATMREDALSDLVQEAGIEGKYQVVCFSTNSWWKEVFKQKITSSPLLTGEIKHKLSIPKADPFCYRYVP